MPLTSKQQKTFMKWLKDHSIPSVCPVCGANGPWHVHDGMIGVLDIDLKRKQASPASMGYFALSCQNCWNTRFFAAPAILKGKT